MADVILKNWDGEEITYSGIDTLAVATPEGELVKFTQGELGEDITADADFSGGDMVLERADGNFIRRATVKKPVNLVPGNIMKDVEIAGIIGTAEGSGGGNFVGDIFKYLFCTVDAEKMEIIVHKVWYEQLFAETGSYDMVIPDTYGEFAVVLNAEGADV